MFNGGSYPSLADIAAVTDGGKNGANGWADGNGWWVLIILFALFGGWGNRGGYGANAGGEYGGALTRGELCQDMNFADLSSAVRSLQSNQDAAFRTVDNAVCSLGYNNAQLANGIQMQVANEFRGVDNAICTLGYNTQQNFNALGSQLASCCCDLNGAIKDNTVQGVMNTNAISQQIASCCCENEKIALQNRFDASQNTCATLQAIDKVGDRIIDYLAADKAQALRDENQALRLAASQQAQNNYLINQLRPCPIPAYPTCNPWAASYGFGTSNGCCGCNG